MRRGIALTAFVAALSTPITPVFADDTVVVPGLAFPGANTYLSSFGCGDLPQAGSGSPQVRIGKGGPGPATGARSFWLHMTGPGSAAGPVHRVDSVAATSVSAFSARSDQGSSGVAFVWFVAPGLEPGQAWVGRTALSVGPGWQRVDTAGATYQWVLADATSGQALEDAGAATIPAFTTAHGDGPGYLLAGFGCDGHEFVLDALQVGSPGAVTTYDLEAVSVSTTISSSADAVDVGEEVTVSGSTLGPGGAPVGASLVLEARPEGSEQFRPVGDRLHSAPDGTVTTTVVPEATTEYRWYLPETGYADAGWSDTVRVLVRPAPAD